MKYVSIDIETTGLDEDSCDILEFGAVLDDLREMAPISTLPIFHCYFIKEAYRGEPQALAMHPAIFARIANRTDGFTYVSSTKFGNMFKKFLVDEGGYKSEKDKVTITAAGKNFAAFDLQFLKRGTDLPKHVKIRSKVLDPAILYLQSSDYVLPGLEDCLGRAGVKDPEVMHNAVSDAMDVVKLIRTKLGEMFI